MRTLDDWLASSASSSSSSLSSTRATRRTTKQAGQRGAKDAQQPQQQQQAASEMTPPTAAPVVAAATTPPQQPQQAPLFVPVEVMVVDRGTQTMCTTSVQTDDAPRAPLSSSYCAHCSHCRHARLLQQQQQSSSLWSLPLLTAPIDAAADAAVLHGEDCTRALREQLALIQHSVDLLIARYQLPPPPLPPSTPS